MREKIVPPQRIVVVSIPQMPEASELAAVVADDLRQRDLTVSHGSLYDEKLRRQVEAGAFDLLIALGGDGTMLRAGHLCAPSKVPILGINHGRLGFLTEVQHSNWQEVMGQLLAGECWLERRMMLRAEHFRGEEALGTWDVLNECVVSRGEVMRPVRLTTEVDSLFLTTYVADGLIVATPTGSTAYALAAGGPILPPELRNILIIAVAPHLSVDRAVVLHEGSWVRVTVRTDHQAMLSADGQASIHLQDGDHVDVRAGEHSALFVRFQDPGYFYRNLTSHMNQNPSAGMQ
jgi:NAD+ kinase